MYSVGDYIVCPGHGVGQICSIETKEMSGEDKSFYIAKIVANGMKVMIPVNSENGLRKLITADEVDDVFSLLKDHNVTPDNSTWNRRHRDYMAKVKTGSLLEIADVLRSLFLLKTSKKLSFGEKKMMEQCKDLIVQEIALTTGSLEKDIDQNINQIFSESE